MEKKYSDFYDYLIVEREIRKTTAKTYIGTLMRLESIDNNFIKIDNFRKIIANFKSENKRNGYLNRITNIIRVYAKFLQAQGTIVDEEFFNLKYFKKQEVNRATMSDEEIEAFLNILPSRGGSKETSHYNVWTLFFSIMAYTGMRPQEVARQTIDTVDLGRGVFIVTGYVSKTHTQRLVPIPPNIKERLKEHLKTCEKYLFPSKNGGTAYNGYPVFNDVEWGYNFHARIKRLGIKRRGLCPYSLRHSLITRLLEEDVNLFKVQKIVGHKRISTTADYTHMTTKDIQLAITKHPLVRKATDPYSILSAFKDVIRSFEFEKNEKFNFNINESNNELEVKIRINTPQPFK